MEEANFNQLLASVKQADAIIRGNTKPTRVTEFADPKHGLEALNNR